MRQPLKLRTFCDSLQLSGRPDGTASGEILGAFKHRSDKYVEIEIPVCCRYIWL